MDQKIEKEIFASLGACLTTLDSFGRKADDLPIIINTWLMAIEPELHAQIPAAVKAHLRQSRCFPTPSDILAIIDPKPEYSRDYYRTLLKRRENGEEKFGDSDYIHAYEDLAKIRANPKPLATQITSIEEVKPIALKGMK